MFFLDFLISNFLEEIDLPDCHGLLDGTGRGWISSQVHK